VEYKHLLVHMDSGSRALERLDLAIALCRRWGARLTGLFAEGQTWGPTLTKGRRPPYSYTKAIRSAAAEFESRVGAARLQSDWWRVPEGEIEIGAIAARFCRYADLSILGQPDPDEGRAPPDLPANVLLESGRPVLLVPSAGHYPDVGRRVIVAWNGSREAARAVHDATPLLREAREVLLVEIRTRGTASSRGEKPQPQADIASHLEAYGIKPRRERLLVSDDEVRATGVEVLDMLLNLSSDFGADLMVMGARGRHGVPFPRAARSTRKSLQAMTAPVLLSH
jgi:nucleotide-binding universal stress UspA family protein